MLAQSKPPARVGHLRPPLRLGKRVVTAIPLLLLASLRIPSFFEPHWYSDEAGYVSTAQGVLHGATLYSGIWTNKPPLQIWTIAAVVALAGPAVWALHLLTLLTSGCALAAVGWFGRRHLSPRRTLVAGCLTALGLGLPIVDAELIVPESLLIAPVTWGCVLVLDALLTSGASRRPRGLLLAGILIAAAIAYQQTAVVEAAMCAGLIVLGSPARWRDLARFGVPVTAVTLGWVGWAVLAAGWSTVSFALVGFWGGYVQGALPQSSEALLTHATELAITVALLGFGVWRTRHPHGATRLLLVWAAAALLIPAAAHHPYAHFLAPAVVPLSLALTSLTWSRGLVPAARTGWHFAPLVAGLAASGVMASYSTLDWLPVTSSRSGTRTLASYYAGFASSVGNNVAFAQWQDSFDDRVFGDEDVAEWLERNDLARLPLVVWSSDAWVYALTDARIPLPTGPIYNDEFLVTGSVNVIQTVTAYDPLLIVTSHDAIEEYPEIAPLLARSYRPVYSSWPNTVWLRTDVTGLGI